MLACLLLIDLQNDFCAGGSLSVLNADEVIPIANKLMPQFTEVIASQDWHPFNHSSFIDLWPVHCVQNTKGAQFHPDLHIEKITKIIQKGTDVDIDSYSAFYDNNHAKSTGLTDYLRSKNITELYVMGLVTEYCVKFSCLDAIKDGFKVNLILEGCKGINQMNEEKALKEMEAQGVRICAKGS